MTDTTTGFEITFEGDGSTTIFNVTSFHIADDDDIDVYLLNETTKAATLQVKTTNYSVSIAEAGTFTVTMVTAPTSTQELFITLNRARTQPTDFVVNGKLSEQSLEEQLDEFPRQIKSLESDIKRSIKGPAGFGDGELGAYPALGLVRINSDQDGFEAVTVSGLNLSSFTFDWADLADLGGSIDSSTDKLLIYDASADENKFINPEDLVQSATASNVGSAGVGVFKQKTGDDLEFKNISVGSNKVTVTDDTGNNEIDIDVDGGKILDGEVAGNGLVTRTTTETYTNRTLTGTSDEIDVADGDGVSGNPTVGLADNAQMPGTEGIRIPNGTTAQRPGTPAVGDLRYNTTTSKVEAYQGSSWVDIDDVDIAGLTQESTLDSTVDMIAIYDASATANRKVDLDDLAAGLDASKLDVAGLTTVTPDTTNDLVAFADASDSNTVKKSTIASIWPTARDWEVASEVTTSSLASGGTVSFDELDFTTYAYKIVGAYDCGDGTEDSELKIDINGAGNWNVRRIYNASTVQTETAQAEATLTVDAAFTAERHIELSITRQDSGYYYVTGVLTDFVGTSSAPAITQVAATSASSSSSSDQDLDLYFTDLVGSDTTTGEFWLLRMEK